MEEQRVYTVSETEIIRKIDPVRRGARRFPRETVKFIQKRIYRLYKQNIFNIVQKKRCRKVRKFYDIHK